MSYTSVNSRKNSRNKGGENFSSYGVQHDVCDCGNELRLQTSWTSANPGRRFLSCAERVNGCRVFYWYDPAMCERSKRIIPGLLKKINALEAQIPLQIPVLQDRIAYLETQLELTNGQTKRFHFSVARFGSVALSLTVVAIVLYTML
ncbi:hypothetical protein ABFS82_05G062000 [Erythranthe guttata]